MFFTIFFITDKIMIKNKKTFVPKQQKEGEKEWHFHS